jgi:hypothetical protein
MKRCPRCQQTKSLEDFQRRRKDGERRQSWCKDCVKGYQRNNPRVLLAKRLVREAKRQPCADCKRRYPYYVLDFDHRPGEAKKANLSILVKRGASREVLLAEIAKCDLGCANCHRKRTYRRRKEERLRRQMLL